MNGYDERRQIKKRKAREKYRQLKGKRGIEGRKKGIKGKRREGETGRTGTGRKEFTTIHEQGLIADELSETGTAVKLVIRCLFPRTQQYCDQTVINSFSQLHTGETKL